MLLYAKAIIPNIRGLNYNQNKPITWITYLDCVHLYGKSMLTELPFKDFEWVDYLDIDVLKIPDISKVGYILEVDIDYPKNLHKKPRFSIFTFKRMSSKFKTIANGLKLVKIYRAIRFSQSKWMAPYIELCINTRVEVNNNFEKHFWKLLISSVFGKYTENVRARTSLRLVSSTKKASKLMMKTYFKDRTICSENLMAIHQHKETIKFDKAIDVGFAILDVSKTFMYDFHYNVMKKKYGDKISSLYSDTDSMTYAIQTQNFFDDIKYNLSPIFDTSNYPKDHYCFSEIHKNQPEILNTYINHINVDDKQTRRDMHFIQSNKHVVHSKTVNKLVLSANDDKRYIMNDGINTL
ncbi:hypothetical protein AGLY_011945, partial [Aphis glycines]